MSYRSRYNNFTFEKEPDIRSTPNPFQLNTSKSINELFPNQNFNGISRKRPASKVGPKYEKKKKTGNLDSFEEEKVLDNDLLNIVGSINADKDIDSDSSTDSVHFNDVFHINDTAIVNERLSSVRGKDTKVQHLLSVKEEQSDDWREMKGQHVAIDKEVTQHKQGEMRGSDSMFSKTLISQPNTISLPKQGKTRGSGSMFSKTLISQPNTISLPKQGKTRGSDSMFSKTLISQPNTISLPKQGETRGSDSMFSKTLISQPNTISLPISFTQKLSSTTRNAGDQLFSNPQQSVKNTATLRKMTPEEFKPESSGVTISPPSLKSNQNCQSFYESMGLDEDLCDSREPVVKTKVSLSRNVEIENPLNVQVKTEMEELPRAEISNSKNNIDMRNQAVPNSDGLHVSMTFEAEPVSDGEFDDDLPLSVLKNQKTSDQIHPQIKSEPESFETEENMESGKVNANVSLISDRIINGIPLIKEELIEEEIETVVSYGKPQNLKKVTGSDLEGKIAGENLSVKIKTEPVDEYFQCDTHASSQINVGQASSMNSLSVESHNDQNISVAAKKDITNNSILKKLLKKNSKSKQVINSNELDYSAPGSSVHSVDGNTSNNWKIGLNPQDISNDSINYMESEVKNRNELKLSLSIPPKKKKKGLTGKKKKCAKKGNIIHESINEEKANSELESLTELSFKPENTLVINKKSTKSNKKKASVKNNTSMINNDINVDTSNSELQSSIELSLMPEENTEIVNKKTTKVNRKKSRGKKNIGLHNEDISINESTNSEFQSSIELSSKAENSRVVNKKSSKSNKKTNIKKNTYPIYDDINIDKSHSELQSPIELYSTSEENTIVNKKVTKINKNKSHAENIGLVFEDAGVDNSVNSEYQSTNELPFKPEGNAGIVKKSTKSKKKKKSVKKRSNRSLEDVNVEQVTAYESATPTELSSKTDENTEIEKEKSVSTDVSTSEDNNEDNIENETEDGKTPEKKVDENLPISLLIRRHTTSDNAEATFMCMDISERALISESTSNSTCNTNLEEASVSSQETPLSSTRKDTLDISLNNELDASSQGKQKKKSRSKQNKKGRTDDSTNEKTSETSNSLPFDVSDNVPTDFDSIFTIQGEERLFSLPESQLDESQSTVGSLPSTVEDFSSKSELSNSAFDMDLSVASKKKKRRPRSFGWYKKKKKKKGKNVSSAELSSTIPLEEPSLPTIAHKSIFSRRPVVVIKNMLPSMNTTKNSDEALENLPSNETSSLPKGKRRKITVPQEEELSATQSDNNSVDKCANSGFTSEPSESLEKVSYDHEEININAPKISDTNLRSNLQSASVSESVSSSNNTNSVFQNLSQHSDQNSKESSSTENNVQKNSLTERSWKLTPSLNMQEIAKDIAQFEALFEKRMTRDTVHTNLEQNVNSLDVINDRGLNKTKDQLHVTENNSDISLLEPNLNSRLNINLSTVSMDSNVNKNKSLRDDLVEIKKEPNIDYLLESAKPSEQTRSNSFNPFRTTSQNESIGNKVSEVHTSELNLIPDNEKISPVQNSFHPNHTEIPASTVSLTNQGITTDNFEKERNLSPTEQNISENSSAIDINSLGLSIKREVFDVAMDISSNNFTIRDQNDLINKACMSKSIQSLDNHFNSLSVVREKSQESLIDEIQIISSDDEDVTCPNSVDECCTVTEKTCEHNKEIHAKQLSQDNFEQISLNKHNSVASLNATDTTSDFSKKKTDAIGVNSKNVEISAKRNLFDARMLYVLAIKNKSSEYLKHPYPPTVVSCNKKLKSKNKAYERISSKTWNLTVDEVKSRLMNSENTVSETEHLIADIIKLEKYAISSSEVGCYHRMLGVAPSHKLLSKCSPNKINEMIDRVIIDSNQRNKFERNINEIGLLDSVIENKNESSHTFSNPIAISDLPSVAEKSNVQFDASIARLCRRSEKVQDNDSDNCNKFLSNKELISSDSEVSSFQISSWSSTKPSYHNSAINAVFNTDVFYAKDSDLHPSPCLNSNSSREHSVYANPSNNNQSTLLHSNSSKKNSFYAKQLDRQSSTCFTSNISTENSSYGKQSDLHLNKYFNSNSSSKNSLYGTQSDLPLSTHLESKNSNSKENCLISNDVLANLTLPSLETVNQLLNSNKTNQTPFVETVPNSSVEAVISAVHRDSPSLSNKHLPLESGASDTTSIQNILNTIINSPVVSVTSETTLNTPESISSTDKQIPVESETLKITTDAPQTISSTNNLNSGLIDFPVIELRKILETVNSSAVSNNPSDDDSSILWKRKETFEYNHTQSIPVVPGNSDVKEKRNDSQKVPLESSETTTARQSENENSDDDFIDAEPVHHDSDTDIDDKSSQENEEEPAPIPQYKSKWEKIMERKSQELKEKEKINDFFLKDCIPVSSLKKPLLKKFKNNQDNLQSETKVVKKSIENDLEVQSNKSLKSDAEVQSKKSKKKTKKSNKSKAKSSPEIHEESIAKEVIEKPGNQKNKSVESSKRTSDSKRKLSSGMEDTSNIFLPDKPVKNSSAKKSITDSKQQESKKLKLGTGSKAQENSKSKFYGNRVTNRGTFLTETSSSEISKQKKIPKKKIHEATKKLFNAHSEEFHSIIKSPDININSPLSTSYKNRNKSLELQKNTDFLYKSPLSNSVPSKTSHFIRTKRQRDRQSCWDSNKATHWDSSKASDWDSSNTYDDINSKNNSDMSLNYKDEANNRNFMDMSSGYNTSNRKTLLGTPKTPLLEIPKVAHLDTSPSNPLYPYDADNILGKSIPSSSSVPSISTQHPTNSFQSNVDPASALVKKIMTVFHTNTVTMSEINATAFPVPTSLNTANISSSSFGVNDTSMQFINSQSNFSGTTAMSSGYPYPNIPVAGSLDPRRAALGIQHHNPVDSIASLNPFRNIPLSEPLDPRKATSANSSNIPAMPSMNPFRTFSPVESLDPRKASLGIHSLNTFKNSPQEAHSQMLNSPPHAAHIQVTRKASCLVPQHLKTMVGYQTIETQNVLLLMLEWSVDWLMQQQKSHDPPPICKSLKKVVSSYDNFEDYYNTYFPLMLLETWQRIYVSWTDLNQTAPYLCQITSYSVKSHYVSIECQSVFSTESRPKGVFPDEGSILMVKYSTKSNEYTIKVLGYVTHVKTRHFNPVTDSKICSSLPIKSDTKPETLQILTLTFMGAYNSEDIDKRQPVCIHVLCNVKHTLKQNDALLYINKSPLHRSILNPVADGLLTFTLTPRSSPEEKIHDCVRDITKGILSPHPLPLLTIVRASPESDRFKIIPLLIQKMKNAYKTKVLLCVRTVRALGDIAANICLQQQSLKLVIINKRCDTNPQFQKYLLDEIVSSEMKKDEEGGRKEKNSKMETYVKMKKQILKDCDVVLSLVRNSHDDFMGLTFLETECVPQMCCIIDEANLCTEPETLIPILYGISKLILIGDPDYSAKVLSKTASSYDYNQSFFQRAYDLDLLTD